MDFSFTDEQRMLRDSLSGYLADRFDFDTRRAVIRSESGRRDADWKAFAEELRILGAPFPEELGGLGGGAVENLVILQAMGEGLSIEPYLPTVVIGGGFLKRWGADQAAEEIAAVIEGRRLFAFAFAEPKSRFDAFDVETAARKDGDGWVLNGRKSVVLGAPWADKLFVTARTSGGRRDFGGISLFLVDKAAAGVTTRDYPTVDGSRASEIAFDNVRAEAIVGEADGAWPLIDQVMDEATAAVCAEALGVMKRLYQTTVDYSKQRRQFGRAIGEFQVLQHRMVDMMMAEEQAVSMTYMATLKLDESASERAKAVSAAKSFVSKACRFVGQSAIQIHGGIGVTDELAVAHYFKRASMIENQFGSADWHTARYECLSFASAA